MDSGNNVRHSGALLPADTHSGEQRRRRWLSCDEEVISGGGGGAAEPLIDFFWLSAP